MEIYCQFYFRGMTLSVVKPKIRLIILTNHKGCNTIHSFNQNWKQLHKDGTERGKTCAKSSRLVWFYF